MELTGLRGGDHVKWFEGDFKESEADKVRRLGQYAVVPKRIKYNNFTRRELSSPIYQ